MCIIVLNTKEHLSKKLLKVCWESNNDGAGLMYANEEKLHIFKELKDFNSFYEHYSTLRSELKKTIIALHFRIATSGNIDIKNIHPFIINHKLAFMHNGIIDIPLQKESKICDTIAFNEKILKQLPSNFLDNPAILDLISRYAQRSRLLFMNNQGKYWIINENLGHWNKKGNWFSNYSYCEYIYPNDRDILWTHDITGNEFCQFCGIELWEDREIANETCYDCMYKFSIECEGNYHHDL